MYVLIRRVDNDELCREIGRFSTIAEAKKYAAEKYRVPKSVWQAADGCECTSPRFDFDDHFEIRRGSS